MLERQLLVYLAGPDVFRPDAVAVGQRKKAICTQFELLGLYPLDEGEPDVAPADDDRRLSSTINGNCLAMLRRCDAVIANLTPFRGPSADVGTAFEHGYAVALGKPVYGYVEGGGTTYRTRVAATAGCCLAHGWTVEDFGLFDNLMLAENLAAPLTDSFEACCEQLVAARSAATAGLD